MTWILWLTCVVLSVSGTRGASTLASQKLWKFESCDFENLDKCAQIVMLFGARSLVIPNNTIDMVSCLPREAET